MFGRLILSILLGVVWMLITGRATLESFLVGTIFGFAVLYLLGVQPANVNTARLPDQVVAAFTYLLAAARDIFLSSVDVARRVLSREMPLRPGIVAVPTQEESRIIAALSAHSITITPGELVVDFDGSDVMYVHCLDVDMTDARSTVAQNRRRRLFRRILGRPLPHETTGE